MDISTLNSQIYRYISDEGTASSDYLRLAREYRGWATRIRDFATRSPAKVPPGMAFSQALFQAQGTEIAKREKLMAFANYLDNFASRLDNMSSQEAEHQANWKQFQKFMSDFQRTSVPVPA